MRLGEKPSRQRMHLAADSRIPLLRSLALHHFAYSLCVVILFHLRVAEVLAPLPHQHALNLAAELLYL